MPPLSISLSGTRIRLRGTGRLHGQCHAGNATDRSLPDTPHKSRIRQKSATLTNDVKRWTKRSSPPAHLPGRVDWQPTPPTVCRERPKENKIAPVVSDTD